MPANNGLKLTAARWHLDARPQLNPVFYGPSNGAREAARAFVRALPLLPMLVLAMSVPLFLGYAIKHTLFPGPLFVVMYSWAILSFVLMPLLWLAELVVVAKAGLGPPAGREDLGPHLLGLEVGTLALVAVLVVRLYG